MKRTLLLFVALAIAFLALGASVFLIRARRPTSSMPNTPVEPQNTAAAPDSTPRGAVTIDARRQQLIGVRTVPATRTTMAPTIRAVGSVRTAETRLADV